MQYRTQAGVSLVEVIIGIALIAGILVVLSQLTTIYMRSVQTTQDTVVAVYQAEAALETARIIRDTEWSSFAALPLDTVLYPEYGAGTASFVPVNPEPSADYQTEIYIRAAYRDIISDDLRTSSDTSTYIDTNARVIEVEVLKDGTSMATQSVLLTNLFDT